MFRSLVELQISVCRNPDFRIYARKLGSVLIDPVEVFLSPAKDFFDYALSLKLFLIVMSTYVILLK